MNDKNELFTKELYDAILKISSMEECIAFLDDLLSKQELKSLSARLHSAIMLKDGFTYKEVIDETKISSATLARVSKCIKNGTGYNDILNKK